MSESLVSTRTVGVLHYISLNRPSKRNAVTMEMLAQLESAFRHADQQTGVRAILVTAEGPIFSAGVDVLGLAQMRAEAGDQNPSRWLRRVAEQMQQTLNVIESTEVPVIGVLHGQVLGLGLELALSFDFRVATSDCKLGLPETRLGLIADVGGTTRLTKLVGPSRTKDLLMTARTVSAEEALQWGLVNRVASPDQALTEAEKLAGQISANAPIAVGLAKLVVDQGDGLPKHTQMAIERWAQSQLIATDDLGEAFGAFMEKRPPVFKGK
ncbi:MAG: 3-hydroxybutyryl-CoA dehydratase [Candidatus Hydrogenedentota bacterium]